MKRDEVIAEAITWLGTPYHHQGTVKGAGVDCGQLLIEVFHAVGLVDKHDAGYYPSDWHFHRSEERYLMAVQKYAKPTETPQKGDIALFKFGRCISHGAIIVEWPLMIHSHLGRGTVYVNANDAELAGRLAGFYTVFED